jgi:hypothetical protein
VILPFRLPSTPGFAAGCGQRDQAGDRLAGTGDGDFGAAGGFIHELGEIGHGGVDVDDGQGGLPVGWT